MGPSLPAGAREGSDAVAEFGDTVRIEMLDTAGQSIFGAIEQLPLLVSQESRILTPAPFFAPI